MVILMKQDKSLVTSVNSRLYQKENAVDNITFYIPQEYNGHDLSEFTATIYYSTQTNNAYMEILEQQESDKENYLMYKLPVTTKFTASVGKVTLEISLLKIDEETSTKYVLHTGVLEINVESWDDFFKYVPDDALSAIDNKILQLDNKVDELKAIADELEIHTPNDLTLTKDLLQLSHDGEVMGNGVEIVIPGDPDDEDEDHDGIIDLDDLPENTSQGEGSEGDTDTDSDSDSLEGETASYYYMEL